MSTIVDTIEGERMQHAISVLIGILLVTSAVAQQESSAVTGRIKSVRIKSKPKVMSYLVTSYSISTRHKRTKKPFILGYAMVEYGDTQRRVYRTRNVQPARVSETMPEVNGSTLRSGASEGRVCALGNGDKIILYRVELWHDGKRLDIKTTATKTKLKTLGESEDWYCGN